MKSKKGKIELSYNPQITADKNGFIIANDVCDSSSDTNQLQSMVNQTEENLSGIPIEIKWSFDNSYYEGQNIKFLEDKKIDGYIPGKIKSKDPYDKSNFSYNEQMDEYICPEKKTLILFRNHYDIMKKKTIKEYKGIGCKECSEQKKCTKTKNGIRVVKQYPYEKERNAIDEKMQKPDAKKIYSLRKEIVEPVFGDVKENKGVTGFLTRGLKKVKTEFNLICAANNIKRMQTKRKDAIQTPKSLMKGLDYNVQDLNFIRYEKSTFLVVFNYRTAC